MTDIDLAMNNGSSAITRLQAALKHSPNNAALKLNLANAYIKTKNYQQAASLLHRYTFDNSDDQNGWELLVQAYGGLNSRAQEMSAQAEVQALDGDFEGAINILQNAKRQTKNNQTLISKIDARINQIQKLQKRYAPYRR